MSRHLRRIFGVLLILLTVASFIGFFVFRQNIEDYIRLRGFNPTNQVRRLAESVYFTDEGKKLFFLGHPSVITDPNTFNQKCNIDEFSIILGCFVDNKDIYVFDVVDKRLSGVEEVTAAHEMLHNAYTRLSSEEKGKVDKMVLDAYKNVKDKRIKEAVASYEKADPSSVPNELHSILGTEVGNLPIELENYYAKYFIDRPKVVAFSKAYSSEFTRREDRVEILDERLESLGNQIDSNKSRIENLASDISSKNQQLDNFQQNNDTASYNNLVPIFNNLVNTHNSLVAQIKIQINDYNQIVVERNNLVVEVQSLVSAIDSTPEELN